MEHFPALPGLPPEAAALSTPLQVFYKVEKENRAL